MGNNNNNYQNIRLNIPRYEFNNNYDNNKNFYWAKNNNIKNRNWYNNLGNNNTNNYCNNNNNNYGINNNSNNDINNNCRGENNNNKKNNNNYYNDRNNSYTISYRNNYNNNNYNNNNNNCNNKNNTINCEKNSENQTSNFNSNFNEPGVKEKVIFASNENKNFDYSNKNFEKKNNNSIFWEHLDTVPPFTLNKYVNIRYKKMNYVFYQITIIELIMNKNHDNLTYYKKNNKNQNRVSYHIVKLKI
ncbi:hypothetical protein H8356DRAFT_1323700 [Neocallimastix lanati (nom. inval.)]|nr:hypothetical protein H8356DRAFT_1323700 [Neocallimastix sp. JGI-2020a]